MRIDHLVTHGTFRIEGRDVELHNNVWLVGDDEEVLVVDPAHDAAAVAAAVGDRSVPAIVLTHGHPDHIDAATEARTLLDAPVLLHAADGMLWRDLYSEDRPDGSLEHGETLAVGGAELTVLHTPGHTPGSVCLSAPELGAVFTGDTLFEGGPGATRPPHGDFETIIDSIRAHLLTLPAATDVHTGHGPATTIGAEAPHLREWIDRGW